MTSAHGVRFLDRTTPPHIATLILLAGISALTMNMFLPSLPGIADDLGAPYPVVQLSVALYLGMTGILQLMIGPLSDRYGRRPVVFVSLILFVVASIGCALAGDITVFLVWRMIQASIVTGLVLSRAIVRDMVPQDQAASMIGWVTMGMAIVPMVGPVIGGFLDEAFGWRSSFWTFAVLGVAMGALAWQDLGETAPLNNATFREQFRKYPALLTAPCFWGYCAATAFASGSFFAYLGGAPYVGSEIFHLSPATLGLFFGAPAVGYMVGNGLSGRFSKQVGTDPMIIAGALITATGLSLAIVLHYAGFRTPILFFSLMTFIGLGNGMVLPNAIAGSLSVRPDLAGTASGLGGAIMVGGGAALSAFAGWILTFGTDAAPLLWTMLSSSLLSIVAILVTMRIGRHQEATALTGS